MQYNYYIKSLLYLCKMDSKQITPQISNEEHRKKVKETYAKEVQPFLEKNRKAYQLYKQGKISLELIHNQRY